ncbi:MAG: aldehyde dehydrogenase family protein [Myxococcaceae bacterium]
MKNDVRHAFDAMQAHRWTVSQTSPAQRIEKLKRLRKSITAHRQEVLDALAKDFRKHPLETEATELFPTLQELKHTIAHLKEWLAPRKVKTPLPLAGTQSHTVYEARGVVLILAPWNYPFNLIFTPLIAAIASGNCVIMRPSEKVPHTAKVINDIVADAFEPREVEVFIEEGTDVASELLELPFDHIFFTGSTKIGKKIALKAAEHLASTTLELGGKSPVIIDDTADIQAAAERVAWGKFINAGQTCVAPDYILIHERVKAPFVDALRKAISSSYGSSEEARKQSPDLARLIDVSALRRIRKLMDDSVKAGAKIELGGEVDEKERYIAPTVLTEVKPGSALMQEEIFGPVLPILTWRSLDEAVHTVRSLGKPLALYVFSNSSSKIDQVLRTTTAGGTLINNVLMHLGNPNLPFGGVGGSGMGSYHGEAGIRAFSHERSVMRQGRLSSLSLLFPPYTAKTERLLAWARKLAS